MVGDFFYIIFIWPIHFLLEFLFVIFIRISYAPGLAIIFLSVVVNTLSLPIYLIASRWQKEERDLQNKMKNKITLIKANFRGDERQMIINAYYRQMGYSTLYLLKASVGLLLQIPFFIAAYQFLSRTSLLEGASFLFLHDLMAPDAFIQLPFPVLGITAFNILPVVMTVINLVSSFIYAKDLGKRDSVQLIVMALLFLILLYQSPSGLVLYWTMNNLYSLVKNAAQAYLKKPGRILHILAGIAGIILLYLVWSGRARLGQYRVLLSGAAVLLVIIPFIWRKIVTLPENENRIHSDMKALYISSIAVIFLLIGFLNPAQILATSAADFDKPLSFLTRTLFQAFSFFFIIPLFIRILASLQIRKILAGGAAILAGISLVSYFILSAYYGVLNRNFTFDDNYRLIHAFPSWISVVVPLGVTACVTLLLFLKKEKLITVFFQLTCAAIIVLGFVDIFTMQKEYAKLKNADVSSHETNAVFTLSRNEKNVFIIFLDKAQGSAMADAIIFYPSLEHELDGFTFYPNTMSFGALTITGVPTLLGGYNFTPERINSRKNELLVDKVNAAISLMPRLFGEAGYRVTITDTVIANLQANPDISIFSDMPNVSAKLLTGTLTQRFRNDFPSSGDTGSGAFDFDYDILFRYGLFRTSPPVFRNIIYYKGLWWRENAYNSYGRAVREFSSLFYLNDICKIDKNTATLNILMNAITHEEGVYSSSFFPQNKTISYIEDELLKFKSESNAQYMYTLMAAIQQLIKWFDFLKTEEVYDNTRIIIVSDHGRGYRSSRDTANMESYNPLFMVKDFNSRGRLIVSDNFMTHADTPYIASDGFSNISLNMEMAINEKNGKLAVVSELSSMPSRHGPYQYNLGSRKELIGREVLKKESWGEWEAIINDK